MSQFERTGVPSSLWDLMVGVPSESGRKLTVAEVKSFNLDKDSPQWSDYVDSRTAKRLGMTKSRYIEYKDYLLTPDAPWQAYTNIVDGTKHRRTILPGGEEILAPAFWRDKRILQNIEVFSPWEMYILRKK